MTVRLGVVEKVHTSGERMLVDAQVEGAIERDLVLIYPLHLRMLVTAGTRVLVLALDENDVQRLALPFEFAAAPVPELGPILHPGAGSKVQVGTVGGTFAPLATLADLDAHRSWALGHIHGSPSGNTTPPTTQPPTPAGTTIQEAE